MIIIGCGRPTETNENLDNYLTNINRIKNESTSGKLITILYFIRSEQLIFKKLQNKI